MECNAMKAFGVNYEGGKIIEHVSSSPMCVEAFNLQISMDAPFRQGESAPESVRAKGRTESTMGVADDSLREQLRLPLKTAVNMCMHGASDVTDAKFLKQYGVEADPGNGVEGPIHPQTSRHAGPCQLVCQVARGRSAITFTRDIVLPILKEFSCAVLGLVDDEGRVGDLGDGQASGAAPTEKEGGMAKGGEVEVLFKYGYRSGTYFNTRKQSKPFVFVNIGMFGRLDDTTAPGVVHAVPCTALIDDGSTPKCPLLQSLLIHQSDRALCITPQLPRCALISVPDHFPFVTPEMYNEETLLMVLERAFKSRQ